MAVNLIFRRPTTTAPITAHSAAFKSPIIEYRITPSHPLRLIANQNCGILREGLGAAPIMTRDSGICTVNIVPLLLELPSVNVPPSARARSRMPVMPSELWFSISFLVMPFPLSVTVKIRPLFFFINVMRAREA